MRTKTKVVRVACYEEVEYVIHLRVRSKASKEEILRAAEKKFLAAPTTFPVTVKERDFWTLPLVKRR